jgi:hypothetical protein
MNTQHPEALRLADQLEGPSTLPSDQIKGAAELRRLHTVNTDLLGVLNRLLNASSDEFLTEQAIRNLAKEAIAKATGATAKSA